MSNTENAAPWWERLPADFHLQADSTDIDHLNPLQIYGTAALDRLARSGLGTMLTLAMGPAMLSRKSVQSDTSRGDFYRDLADRSDAEEIFQRPPRNVAVRRRKPGRFEYRPKNIPCEILSFESPFEPLHPELQNTYRHLKRNRTAQAQYWSHPDGPRPTLIFLHGVYLNDYAINSRMFSLPWFYKQGYDILLVTMPFHGPRKERLDPFSGYGWFAHGFSHINESMLQAVYDASVWMDFLEEQGAPSFGASGLSLGGYITSLLAAADDRLAFAIPNSPVVAPVDMALEWVPIRWVFQSAMERYQVTLAELRHMMALHSPLSFAPQLPAEKLMIIGGAGDRFTAPRFVRLLHEHWQGSRLQWFPGNHVIHLGQNIYLQEMLKFMDACCAQAESS